MFNVICILFIVKRKPKKMRGVAEQSEKNLVILLRIDPL